MPNRYLCSDGKMVTEATIQKNLSVAYKKRYLGRGVSLCEGCNEKLAQCTAHIVPKARLKQLGKTEYIWNSVDWFAACYECNAIAENPRSEDIKKLRNYDRILRVTKELDFERYLKMTL